MVVGAGLGGLTLAQGLRRAGIEVAVYERDQLAGRPQGFSLHFDDRGRAALRGCLPAEHVALAEATMGGPRERISFLADVDGILTVADTQPLDGAEGRTRPGRQASRRLLRAVLLSGIEDAVRFGAELARFEHRPDGTVQAWFSDGTCDVADVLVGADGIGSTVRRQYLPHVHVLDTGRRMLMGASPLRDTAKTGIPDLIGDNPATLRSGNGMMAMGVLRLGESAQAARDRFLPGLRARDIEEAESYVMWAIPVAKDRVDAAAESAAIWQTAQTIADGLHPQLRAIVDAAWSAATAALRIGTIPPMAPWPTTPVTVIGDAIHVAPGFGGNLALQDAHRLSAALAAVAAGEQELIEAVRSYEDVMRRDNFSAPAMPR